MEIKTRILELLNEMLDDSKSKSYKAEKELCIILTEFINKKDKFENALGRYVYDYPKRIFNVENDFRYEKLPDEIVCNDEYFTFNTEWLDINWEEYFNQIKKDKVSYLTGLIERVEATVVKHKEELQKYSEMTFDDIKHIIEN